MSIRTRVELSCRDLGFNVECRGVGKGFFYSGMIGGIHSRKLGERGP